MKHEQLKSPEALAAFAALKDPSAPEWSLEQKFNEQTGLWECPGLKYLPLHRSGPAYGLPRLVFWALAALALFWACRGQIGPEIAQAAKILGLAAMSGVSL